MYLYLYVGNEKVGVINQDYLLKEDAEGFQSVGVGSVITLNDYQYKVLALKPAENEQLEGRNLLLEQIK
ncbi:hypothetical protein [Bacillus taeanensis]|uniref:Uncharacterized protein n=1 Tax=Bacillus taeanensis TaxID=273032 RepID=A0A366XUX8_9BACI|nr:hypothetical protein [Bacillus taeanensis]RBW69466.1 hypothetical protein DS031_11115 [Bacillus taeanensis]